MGKQKIIDRRKQCYTRKLRPTNRILWSPSSSSSPPPISSTFHCFFSSFTRLRPTNRNDGYYKWVLATAGKHKLDDNLCYFALKNHLRIESHTINRRHNDDDVVRVCVCCVQSEIARAICHAIHASICQRKMTNKRKENPKDVMLALILDIIVVSAFHLIYIRHFALMFFSPLVLCFHFYVCGMKASF